MKHVIHLAFMCDALITIEDRGADLSPNAEPGQHEAKLEIVHAGAGPLSFFSPPSTPTELLADPAARAAWQAAVLHFLALEREKHLLNVDASIEGTQPKGSA